MNKEQLLNRIGEHNKRLEQLQALIHQSSNELQATYGAKQECEWHLQQIIKAEREAEKLEKEQQATDANTAEQPIAIFQKFIILEFEFLGLAHKPGFTQLCG